MKNFALTASYLAGGSSFILLIEDVAQIGDIEFYCDLRVGAFASCVLEMKFLVPSAVSGFEILTDLLPPSVFIPADMNEVFLLAPLDAGSETLPPAVLAEGADPCDTYDD